MEYTMEQKWNIIGYTMEHHGISMHYRISWNIYGTSMEYNGIPLEYHGIYWNIMEYH